MTVELVFESRLSFQLLRQEGSIESEPVISLQLALTGGPQIYASDASIINEAAWRMRIHRHGNARLDPVHAVGRMGYSNGSDKACCAIEVHQSPERYGALLDMFKDGYVSEITMVVEGLSDKADYSKSWDTARGAELIVKSICFEFPLPQSEA